MKCLQYMLKRSLDVSERVWQSDLDSYLINTKSYQENFNLFNLLFLDLLPLIS